MSKESPAKHPSSTTDNPSMEHVPKIFVVCEQKDTAPLWGNILRQKGLTVILETSLEKAIDHWASEITDLIVLDIDIMHPNCVDLYKTFRAISGIPVLLFIPVYHETHILEAYAAGVDDVIVKPIGPFILVAKIMAWARRSWTMPIEGLSLVKVGIHRLDPARRCLIDQAGTEVKLTNLEFRLLHLLMNQPGQILSADDLVKSIWGGYDSGNHVLLKNVVYRLRKKIEANPGNPVILQTWPGGYSFHG